LTEWPSCEAKGHCGTLQVSVSSAVFSLPKPASCMVTVMQQNPISLFLTELSIAAFIFLASSRGQETRTSPARLEQIKTMKILKYATGRSHILTD